MKVLFVFSGNNPAGISPIIKTQGESLTKAGIDLDYYPVRGSGFRGYMKNIAPLRKAIRRQEYDIIHAHNDLCGIIAAVSTSRPVLTSLMGSEVHSRKPRLWMIRLFTRFFWKGTIVKSKSMSHRVSPHRTWVIPNGVDLHKFKKTSRNLAQKKIAFDPSLKHVLFLADPGRPEKNFDLARKAVKLLNDNTIQLKPIFQSDHEMVPVYLNAAHLLLLTSTWEGSPNVVKEALACECPVVSTRVGDVEELLDGVAGCFTTSDDPADIADKILLSLSTSSGTEGREKMQAYSTEKIAIKIIEKYHSLSNKV